MSASLVVCGSCRCHVRVMEAACPHCDADLAREGALQPARRRALEVRRMLFAVALAGAGAACGTSGKSSDPMVVGSCVPNGGVQSTSCANQQHDAGTFADCYCGRNGRCDGQGVCEACSCQANEDCNPDGTCSVHTCYGCPPLLA
jgi:hypothetical protein